MTDAGYASDGDGLFAGSGGSEGEGGAQAAPDLERLESRFEELRGDILPLVESLRDSGDEGDGDGQDYGQMFADQLAQYAGAEDEHGEQQGGQDEIAELFNQVVQQAVQEHMQPIQERFREEELLALEEQYPDLQDEKVADAVVDTALELGREFAQQVGDPRVMELAKQPAFVELVYKAMRADQFAQGERPQGANQREVQLESAAGTNPGPPSGEDLAMQVVRAGNNGNVFPDW